VEVTFLAPVQTGLGAHPAYYKMGTGVFTEVKRPERGAEHPPPSSAEVKERVQLYLYSPFGPSWPVLVTLLGRYMNLRQETVGDSIMRIFMISTPNETLLE
jgi:hypothetical protein